jgi:anti-sigma factor RsiW
MSGIRPAVGEDDLHAWLDGRLSAERAAAVDLYLAEHPEKQERWSQYAAQRQALRAAFRYRRTSRSRSACGSPGSSNFGVDDAGVSHRSPPA